MDGLIIGSPLPHVTTVHDVISDGEQCGLVTDLIAGTDLRAVLREQGRLPPGLVCALGAQMARGLAGAHARGVLHHDLKPENVLLDRDGDQWKVYLTDFGVTRIIDLTRADQSSGPVGKPDYVAPEVISGQAGDGSADVYALGVVLYESVAGERLFSGADVASVRQQQLTAKPQRPSSTPEGLWSVIERCLLKAASERPSAVQLVDELTALAAEPGYGSRLGADLTRPPTPLEEADTRSQPTRLESDGLQRRLEASSGSEDAVTGHHAAFGRLEGRALPESRATRRRRASDGQRPAWLHRVPVLIASVLLLTGGVIGGAYALVNDGSHPRLDPTGGGAAQVSISSSRSAAAATASQRPSTPSHSPGREDQAASPTHSGIASPTTPPPAIAATESVTNAPTGPSPVPRGTSPTSSARYVTGYGGLCLDVRGPSSADGTPVQMWHCNGATEMKWTLTAAGEIRGYGGLCLDVRGPSTADGTPVQMWHCNGATEMKWTLSAA